MSSREGESGPYAEFGNALSEATGTGGGGQPPRRPTGPPPPRPTDPPAGSTAASARLSFSSAGTPSTGSSVPTAPLRDPSRPNMSTLAGLSSVRSAVQQAAANSGRGSQVHHGSGLPPTGNPLTGQQIPVTGVVSQA
ncbi:hypothetical protein PHYPSEUDO_012223 [Phytophthora pseudosyringae]|uniref:Uncharacterized protein n=1 Tax=Phytophthora pseudosyringae TaxID=221518 RepID=A0A8T1V9Z0_9STRA|nr:hypothetical protein PHYPSEUDO_012223 [Phytophthora pseudosyringae]